MVQVQVEEVQEGSVRTLGNGTFSYTLRLNIGDELEALIESSSNVITYRKLLSEWKEGKRKKEILKMFLSYFRPTMTIKEFEECFVTFGIAKENDPEILVLLLQNVLVLVKLHGYHSAELYKCIMDRFISEENGLIAIPEILRLSLDILYLAHKHDALTLDRKMYPLLLNALRNPRVLIRKSALRLIAFSINIFEPEKSAEESAQLLALLLERFTKDKDCRMRRFAVHILLELSTIDDNLFQNDSLYKCALKCLKDDDAKVREEAIYLILAYVNRKVGEKVVLSNGEAISLVDDAFGKVCDLVNDPSLQVRQTASLVLGQFTGVSDAFLIQTFSKEVISHLKRKKRLLEVAENSAIDENPNEAVEEFLSQEFRILDLGAAGAFIHALEDEFSKVRYNALCSIKELSKVSEVFAKTSIEFLVDMMNDEIDNVRLEALRALQFVLSKYSCILHLEHLNVIVGVLDDANPVLRFGVRSMLQCCQMIDSASVKLCFSALRNNLQRYREDQNSIYETASFIAFKHGLLVGRIPLEELYLDTNKHFLSPEQLVDDPFYSLTVIFVTNSCFSNPKIIPLLPERFSSHAAYLSIKYSSCFRIKSFPMLNLLLPDEKGLSASVNRPSLKVLLIQLIESKGASSRSSLEPLMQRLLEGSELLLKIGNDLESSELKSSIEEKVRLLLRKSCYLLHMSQNLTKNERILILYWRLCCNFAFSKINDDTLYKSAFTFWNDVLTSLDFSLEFDESVNPFRHFKAFCQSLSEDQGRIGSRTFISATLHRPDDTLKAKEIYDDFPTEISVSGTFSYDIAAAESQCITQQMVIVLIYPDLTIKLYPINQEGDELNIISQSTDALRDKDNLSSPSITVQSFEEKVYLNAKTTWRESKVTFLLARLVKPSQSSTWPLSSEECNLINESSKIGSSLATSFDPSQQADWLYASTVNGLLIPCSNLKCISTYSVNKK